MDRVIIRRRQGGNENLNKLGEQFTILATCPA